MLSFLIRRTLLGLLTLFGVILITFMLVRVVPSDPARQWVGSRATLEQVEVAREELGLNKPIYVQFKLYLRNLLKGDLGYSHMTHLPVSEELKSQFPATLELVFFSFIGTLIIGIPLGLLSANAKNSWIDHFSRFFSIGIISNPVFWLALILQLIFFKNLGVLPSGGQLSMRMKIFYDIPRITGFMFFDSLITGNFVVLKDFLKHLILPAICVGAYGTGLVSRMTRSAMVEILNEDYIKAARSYGLPKRLILFSYALKNSLGPTVTAATLCMGTALMNTFLVETIFGWPGIGKYVADAIVTLNYPAIMGVTIIATSAYVVLNLIADVIISVDPRVKL